MLTVLTVAGITAVSATIIPTSVPTPGSVATGASGEPPRYLRKRRKYLSTIRSSEDVY